MKKLFKIGKVVEKLLLCFYFKEEKMRIRKRSWTQKELNECVFYFEHPQNKKGKWKQSFEKDQILHLELGCGKGTFVAKLALENQNINYLAVDLIDTMLGFAKRNIEEAFAEKNLEIQNVKLARCDIERILTMMDEKDQVERIYINFCNPWPRGKHHKKRLTHPKQLELYKTFLTINGEIHFKTDDDLLFEHSLGYFEQAGYEILWKTYDLHQENRTDNIKTEHEKMFSEEGIKIKALIAKRK